MSKVIMYASIILISTLVLLAVIYKLNISNVIDTSNSANIRSIIEHPKNDNVKNSQKNTSTNNSRYMTGYPNSYNGSNSNISITNTLSMLNNTPIRAIKTFFTIKEFLENTGGCVIYVTIPAKYSYYYTKVKPGDRLVVPINITFIGGYKCLYKSIMIDIRDEKTTIRYTY